jgi:hypothetical protein
VDLTPIASCALTALLGVSVWPFNGALSLSPGPTDAAAVTKSLQRDFDTESAWAALVRAPPPRKDSINDPSSRPKLCFINQTKGQTHCTTLQTLFGSSLADQSFTDLSIAPLRSQSPQTSGLILRALGGYPSGHVYETAIWVYDAAKDAFNLIAVIAAGDFSEVRIVNEGQLDGYLIAAHWSWSKDEGRWDDHRRQITVYRFDVTTRPGAYRQVLEYTTAKKYGAEDADTISSEWGAILMRSGSSANR